MKKKSGISMGPGAASLILIFVLLSISVLGMLSLLNSRNDASLSQRSAEVAEAVYNLNAAAEEARAELSELLLGQNISVLSDAEPVSLPDRFTAAGGLITWTEEDDTRTLQLEVRAETDENGIITHLKWTRHTMSSNIGEGGDEWNW